MLQAATTNGSTYNVFDMGDCTLVNLSSIVWRLQMFAPALSYHIGLRRLVDKLITSFKYVLEEEQKSHASDFRCVASNTLEEILSNLAISGRPRYRQALSCFIKLMHW